MSINNNGFNLDGSEMMFPAGAVLEDEGPRRKGHGRQMFLAGGLMGSLYPLGVFPADGFEDGSEEEDPNP